MSVLLTGELRVNPVHRSSMSRKSIGWDELRLAERPAVELLDSLGYTGLSPEDLKPERTSFKEPILINRLAMTLKRLNPLLSETNPTKAGKAVTQVPAASLSRIRTARKPSARDVPVSLSAPAETVEGGRAGGAVRERPGHDPDRGVRRYSCARCSGAGRNPFQPASASGETAILPWRLDEDLPPCRATVPRQLLRHRR